MKAVRLQLANSTLLNPTAPQWAKVPAEEIAMGGTPLHQQPSHYTRTAWAGKQVGAAARLLRVQAAHNGKNIAFRLEWADETQNKDHGDGTQFPDAAGILFPLKGEAPLESMGSPDAPVNAWYWRASSPENEAQNLIATGVGTVEETPNSAVQANGVWAKGRWRVVITRPLAVRKNGVRLSPKKPTKVAFAVWEGSSQQRAGLKSFSRAWWELEI